MGALERLKKYIDEHGLRPHILVSAPGRVDFLNTHQDYKGLPVVPMAVNLRIYMAAVKKLDSKFVVESLDLGEKSTFEIDDQLTRGREFTDYLKACVIALKKHANIRIESGYHIIISSDIPIGGGMGSSGALEVCFIKILEGLIGFKMDKKTIAETAFIAENKVMGIPCGRLDQYASAFGGIIMLKPTWPPKIEELNTPPLEILVVDSGVKHETASIHPIRQEEIMQGVRELLELEIPESLRRKLTGRIDTIRWEEIMEDEIAEYLESINRTYAKRILFTIRMNDLTKIAVRILKGQSPSKKDIERLKNLGIKAEEPADILCGIVNKQHELLRDLYEVSIPEIEKIIDNAMSSGARAAKISGAGLGGCIIILAEEKDIANIIESCLDAGAKKVWNVKVDEGARIEEI